MKLVIPFSNFYTRLSAAAAAAGLFLSIEVHSHGYAWDPLSRNAYAHEYGVGSGTDNDVDPIRTWNHAGLENGGDTFGACGYKRFDSRYWTTPSEWVTPDGNTVPFKAQATYIEGQEIIIRSFVKANHRGHIEMYGCSNVQNPTDSCFRQNPLEFVEDLLHGAPKDTNYPSRAMLAPPDEWITNVMVDTSTPDGEVGDLYVHKFKLPDNFYGNEVLLQWFWVTANGCRAPGYISYPWPDASWHPTGSLNNVCDTTNGWADCSRDYTNCRDPQIFRNCIEVRINQSGPPAPTSTPSQHPSLRPSSSYPPTNAESSRPSMEPTQSPYPTAYPTHSPTDTPNNPAACCSENHRDCHPQINDACNQDESSCLNCNRYWLSGGAQTGCQPDRYGCDNASPCCEGLVCTPQGSNNMCIKA